MSYISPAVRQKLDELSDGLRDQILARNVPLHTVYDLIQVLEEIVEEG